MGSQRKGEFHSCTVIERLREAADAVEQWHAELLAEIEDRKEAETCLLNEREKFANEIAARKAEETVTLEERDDLILSIAGLEERIALFLDERRKLLDKIATQNERESRLLEEREKLSHEIIVRKRTKSLLIRERKELLQEKSALKMRERTLQGLASRRTDSQRKTKAVLLQVRKGLLNKIGSQKQTEKVLLYDRMEMISYFSKRIHAHKKREAQLLQKHKKTKVKLSKALNRLRHRRGSISDRIVSIFWDVTQKVISLTADIEECQLDRVKTNSARVKSHLQMPKSLPSSWKQATRVIKRAADAVAEARQNLKRDRECIEAMKVFSREGLIEKILGRKERSSEAQGALRDILHECQNMEQQPQSKYKTLETVRHENGENEKLRRKQNNPQRVKARPSPSREDLEVSRKRPKIEPCTSSPPYCEAARGPRPRKSLKDTVPALLHPASEERWRVNVSNRKDLRVFLEAVCKFSTPFGGEHHQRIPWRIVLCTARDGSGGKLPCATSLQRYSGICKGATVIDVVLFVGSDHCCYLLTVHG